MACGGRSAPLVRRGHRRLGGRLTTVRRAMRLSSSSGASARGAGSQGSVSSGIKSPPVRVLALASRALGAERIEDPTRGVRPRMLPLHHAPLIFQGAEHESLRSQYAREPAAGCVGLFFVAIRVMVAEPYNPHLFESGAVRRSVPLDGRVDQPAIAASWFWDVATGRPRSRPDPEPGIAPRWAPRSERPSR